MATKRMFNIAFIQGETFLSLTAVQKVLYFNLLALADDDGIVSQKRLAVMLTGEGSSEKDIEKLCAADLILKVNDLLIVTDWKRHNYIQSDRYHPTIYQTEFNRISEVDGHYYLLPKTDCEQDVSNTDTKCIPNVSSNRLTRLDKNNKSKLDKYSKAKISKVEVKKGTSFDELVNKIAEEHGVANMT